MKCPPFVGKYYILSNKRGFYILKGYLKGFVDNALRPFCIEKNYSRKCCIMLTYEINNAALSSNAFILPK